jgi:cold shock CspA family protein
MSKLPFSSGISKTNWAEDESDSDNDDFAPLPPRAASPPAPGDGDDDAAAAAAPAGSGGGGVDSDDSDSDSDSDSDKSESDAEEEEEEAEEEAASDEATPAVEAPPAVVLLKDMSKAERKALKAKELDDLDALLGDMGVLPPPPVADAPGTAAAAAPPAAPAADTKGKKDKKKGKKGKPDADGAAAAAPAAGGASEGASVEVKSAAEVLKAKKAAGDQKKAPSAGSAAKAAAAAEVKKRADGKKKKDKGGFSQADEDANVGMAAPAAAAAVAMVSAKPPDKAPRKDGSSSSGKTAAAAPVAGAPSGQRPKPANWGTMSKAQRESWRCHASAAAATASAAPSTDGKGGKKGDKRKKERRLPLASILKATAAAASAGGAASSGVVSGAASAEHEADADLCAAFEEATQVLSDLACSYPSVGSFSGEMAEVWAWYKGSPCRPELVSVFGRRFAESVIAFIPKFLVKTKANPKCPGGHEMLRNHSSPYLDEELPDPCTCDGCEQVIFAEAGSLGFHCSECKFDLCINCHFKCGALTTEESTSECNRERLADDISSFSTFVATAQEAELNIEHEKRHEGTLDNVKSLRPNMMRKTNKLAAIAQFEQDEKSADAKHHEKIKSIREEADSLQKGLVSNLEVLRSIGNRGMHPFMCNEVSTSESRGFVIRVLEVAVLIGRTICLPNIGVPKRGKRSLLRHLSISAVGDGDAAQPSPIVKSKMTLPKAAAIAACKLDGVSINPTGDCSEEETGKVLKWDAKRGFGFIKPDNGGDDLYCHRSKIDDKTQRLVIGSRVRYVKIDTARGPSATHVFITMSVREEESGEDIFCLVRERGLALASLGDKEGSPGSKICADAMSCIVDDRRSAAIAIPICGRRFVEAAQAHLAGWTMEERGRKKFSKENKIEVRKLVREALGEPDDNVAISPRQEMLETAMKMLSNCGIGAAHVNAASQHSISLREQLSCMLLVASRMIDQAEAAPLDTSWSDRSCDTLAGCLSRTGL